MRPIDVIEGKVSVLDRNDVDTDQIIPKQFLKRVERTGFGEFLFYDWIRDGEIELEPNPILVAGRNFGCGSSREHAPWALEDFGFEAIVAPSFADIFYSNCTKIGLLPAIVDEAHCKPIAEAGEARIDVDDETIDCGTTGVFPFEVHPEVKHRLLNGLDDIGITLQNVGAIDAYESSGRITARSPPASSRWTTMAESSTRDWDARTYQRVAVPHEEWARARARPARPRGRGDRPRRRLRLRPHHRDRDRAAPRGPRDRGRRLALDGRGGAARCCARRTTALVSDLTKLELDEQVDAVFSTAVFHWILDHDALFARMRAALRDGGRFAAQCGGEGNIDAFRVAGRGGRAREPYAAHLGGIRGALELRRAGGDRRAPARRGLRPTSSCWLEPWPVDPPEPARLRADVCLGAHVDALPDELRDRFVADVLATQASPLRLGYVRLNIEATAA